MPETANPKTANPKTANLKTANPSSATVRVPPTARASIAGPTLVAAPVKTTPQSRAPFSTGSPLLDSFISSSAEKTVYIPNPHIMGDRFGSRQGPSFRNVTLNGPTPHPARTRFDGEDFKRAGLASADVPIKKSSKAIQLKSQPPQSGSDQQPETAKNQRQSNQQAAANAQLADTQEQPSPVQSNKQSSKQPKAQKTVGKLGKKPHRSTTSQSVGKSTNGKSTNGKSTNGKSAEPTSDKARRRPQPGTVSPKGSAPISRQNGSRPTAAPNTGNPVAASGPRVYGGSDYKALQSRAAAGGLVDLEDTLLFGGAEDKSSPLSIGNAPPGAENNPMAVLEYLLVLPSAFTLTKPEGNRAILDDFSWLERPAFIPTQAVIDARNFEVVEQPSPQTQTVQPRRDQAGAGDSAELKVLTQKIDQLHQRIEYLSKRLASFDAASSAENGAISPANILDTAEIEQPQPTASALFQEPSVM